MKHITRFFIAIVLVGILALIASGVWASARFKGTVPLVPPIGNGNCTNPAKTIDMGTALFTAQGTTCTFKVEKVDKPAEVYAPAPAGLAFAGDTFKVTINPQTESVEIVFAYPPEFASKAIKIYRLDEAANPPVWVEVPGSVIENGKISITGSSGVYTLIGNP
jgi:hypothetical protein